MYFILTSQQGVRGSHPMAKQTQEDSTPTKHLYVKQRFLECALELYCHFCSKSYEIDFPVQSTRLLSAANIHHNGKT